MIMSLSRNELFEYVNGQLDCFFPGNNKLEKEKLGSSFDLALDRLEYCYKHVVFRGYRKGDTPFFSHLHGDQYTQFLYYYANSIWKNENSSPEMCEICDRLMQLIRLLGGVFVSYKNMLPDIFLWIHPVGTVLGNAEYGDYFVCFQGCTVSTRVGIKQIDRKIGEGLYLSSGAQIIDNRVVGKHVIVGAGTSVYKEALPDNSIVYRNEEGHLIVKPKESGEYRRLMSEIYDVTQFSM